MLPLQVAHIFLTSLRSLSCALSNAQRFLTLDGAAIGQPDCKAPPLPAVDPLSLWV